MPLPYDVSRCLGANSPRCNTCRRTEPGGEIQWYIAEQINEQGECPNYIAQEGKENE